MNILQSHLLKTHAHSVGKNKHIAPHAYDRTNAERRLSTPSFLYASVTASLGALVLTHSLSANYSTLPLTPSLHPPRFLNVSKPPTAPRPPTNFEMGKSTSTSTALPSSKQSTTSNIDQQCTLMNYVLFVLCTLSLGCTAFAAYRQCNVDDTRIRHIRRLDDRITVLEHKLRHIAETSTKTSEQSDIQLPMLRRISIANNNNNNGTTSSTLSASSSSSSGEGEDAFSAYPAAEMLQALQKLSLHDSGIERLRRDISQLQSSRAVRQSSMIQSTQDCGCPAGECAKFFGLMNVYNYMLYTHSFSLTHLQFSGWRILQIDFEMMRAEATL